MNQKEYSDRREQFMSKIGQGTAIFCSADHAVMHNDVEYNFRQDSNFFYFTGFDEPQAVVVLAPHHPEHKYILFVRPKDQEKETWSGLRWGVDATKETFGADIVYPINELDEKLPQYLQKADKIYYHFGRNEQFNNKIIRIWRGLMQTYSRTGLAPFVLEDPRLIVGALRLIKSDYELTLMRRAIALSCEAHNRAFEMTKAGIYEYQIQAEIEYIFAKNGGAIAYPSIVASGENSCILHYVENNKQMQNGDLLLIDAGCCYQYYNGDITRTFPVSGKFTPEQKTIYEIVLAAQKASIEQVKQGNSSYLVHTAAVNVIVEGLLELGLLTGDKEEIIKEEKYKPFYMHKTSHWLGLDVHDAGLYKIGEETWQSLQSGQILTVEPGIYISPNIKPVEGQPEVNERWKGIGIRIEDDVLVTTNGYEVLTSAVPKSVADMEK
jgi:Xaa-Pro aminopeptidase